MRVTAFDKHSKIHPDNLRMNKEEKKNNYNYYNVGESFGYF